MFHRRQFLAFLAAQSATVAIPSLSWATTYPTKAIKIIVPAAPGGPNDIVARLSAKLLDKLGQPIVVENHPGAAGVIGARDVAHAQPDGYTLLVGNTNTLAVLPAVSRKTGYDPTTSFAPVAKILESYQILVVSPSFPARTLQELISYAKANPGKLNYAHGGTGGLPHLSGEMFKLHAGVDIVAVPYRSDAECATAVLSGAVQMTFANMTVLLPLIKKGQLRALAITSPQRTPLAPDLPTMIEGGLPNYKVTAFFGLVAPAGTPSSIVQQLNGTINEGLKAPENRSMISALGGMVAPLTAQEFGAFIAETRQQWSAVANKTGIHID